jgi:hypothetical protein
MSDLHLNFVPEAFVRSFAERVRDWSKPDALVLSGDTAEANNLFTYLGLLHKLVGKPIYYVLGNHDFYRADLEFVREEAEKFNGTKEIVWLPTGVVRLTPKTTLVGVDGWGDARIGDHKGSRVELADWEYIQDFRSIGARYDRAKLVALCRKLGAQDSKRLQTLLADVGDCENLYIATHVPPFEGAAWHQGKVSNKDWLPWFTCDLVGKTILDFADQHKSLKITVLCGHTHGGGLYAPRPNVLVKTAPAQYGCPAVEEVFDVP